MKINIIILLTIIIIVIMNIIIIIIIILNIINNNNIIIILNINNNNSHHHQQQQQQHILSYITVTAINHYMSSFSLTEMNLPSLHGPIWMRSPSLTLPISILPTYT